MDISVIIPTHKRPAKVLACLDRLAHQTHPSDRYEILIGLDGADTNERAALEDRAATCPMSVRIVPCPRSGQAAVRNTLIAQARGRLLGMLNDDMLPQPAWVAAHVNAHTEAAGRHIPAPIITGSSPWTRHEPDRLFDRLIRDTSMVFFHHHMDAADRAVSDGDTARWRDWGFRHAWTLNLSAPRDAVVRVGGFSVFPCTYGYEDDELAFRLRSVLGSPVLHRSEAVAEHDHRMTPDEYLMREYRLGYAALGFARRAHACALAMFRRDVTEIPGLMYDRVSLIREARDVTRLLSPFRALANLPADALKPGYDEPILNLIYQQHLPLKRWTFRRGLIDAAEGRPMRDTIEDALSLLNDFSTANLAA